MSLDEGLSKLIGGLYEAVHDREGWRAAIAEIMDRSGSRRALVSSLDLRRKNIIDVQFHGPEDSCVETGAREYADYMSALDPALNWAYENPAAGGCESAAMLSEGDYCDHQFIKWWRSRFGTLHWRAFYTQPVDELSFSVSFHPAPDAGPPTRDQLPLEALLFENMERAVRLAARPPNFASDDSALIAIDAMGRALSLSQRAEELLQDADGLGISGGFMTARHPEVARQLQRAIRAAINPSLGERPGRGIRISRASGKSDLFLVVSHIPPSLDHLPRPVPAALIRLLELETRPQHLSDHSHLFDLTRRETEVASALLEGHSIDSMSATLGMSRNTARNHLQALFRKTRTNRQSELIRMLGRLARQ